MRLLWLSLLFGASVARGIENLATFTVATNSRLTLVLCSQGACDTNTQPLTGTMDLAFDWSMPEGQASLRDFHLRAANPFTFRLNYGLFGSISAGLTNLEIYPAAPGPGQPFFPLTNGQVTFVNVETLLSGAAGYNASGFACVALQNNGLLCADTLNLANSGTNTIAAFPVQLSVSNGIFHLSGMFQFSRPLSETNATLGTLSGSATLAAVSFANPPLRVTLNPENHVVSWPSLFQGFRLYRASSLSPPSSWELVPAAPFDDGVTTSVLLPNEPVNSFYRLQSD